MIGILRKEFQLAANYEKRLKPHIVNCVNDILEVIRSVTAFFFHI